MLDHIDVHFAGMKIIRIVEKNLTWPPNSPRHVNNSTSFVYKSFHAHQQNIKIITWWIIRWQVNVLWNVFRTPLLWEVRAHKHSNYAATSCFRGGMGQRRNLLFNMEWTLSKAHARKACVDPENLYIYHIYHGLREGKQHKAMIYVMKHV